MTMAAEKAFPAYGNLPKSWTRRRLRFDVHLNPKKSSLDMEPGELVSFVPMDAVGEYGGLNLDEVRELEEVYNGYTYFADGDLCIAKITPCFENGKGGLAEGLTNGVGFGTTELHVVRAGPSIDRRFLFYISVADDFRKLGESEMYGAGGQKRIDEGFIKDWMPPLPPLDTQRRIARFLDEKTARIDALLKKKRALLDRLAEKRQALITRAVTKGLPAAAAARAGLNPDAPLKPSGIDWLGDIPAHWEVKRLDRLTEPRRPIRYGIVLPGPHIDDGVPIIKGGDVRPERLNLDTLSRTTYEIDAAHSRSRLKVGDIVYSIRGSFGDIELLPPELDGINLTQDAARIAPVDAVDREWLALTLKSDAVRLQMAASAVGATIKGINIRDLRRALLPLPPPAEQVTLKSWLKNRVSEIDRQRSLVLKSTSVLEEYRSALVTAAVTGQVRELR
mgnify:CR=1 FL=1